MAHNLAATRGTVAMAYQGETPWHQLGHRMTPEIAADISQSMTVAGLDYEVELEQLYLDDGRSVPNRNAVIRQDDRAILGTVSGWYKPIQNADAFNVFQPAMEEFGLTVEAAGALGKGERAWMLFKLPTDCEPVKGDKVSGYGVAVTGHDGRNTFEFRPTPIRVVCQNTLDYAIERSRKGRVFGISHIGNVDDQVNSARKLVSNAIATMQATGDTFASLADKHMTPEETVAYIEKVFPNPHPAKDVSKQLADRRSAVASLVWTGVGSELAGSNQDGTNAWAAYNAVTEYFDHIATAKPKTKQGQTNANTSALFGAGAEFKTKAFVAARELVAV